MVRSFGGYIGVEVDHYQNDALLPEDYEIRDEELYCPSCSLQDFPSRLGRKIVLIKETKWGRRVSKNPIADLGLDPDKEYRQCRQCGNIYDLADLVEKRFTQEDLNHAYRTGDYIPGPGVSASKTKPKRRNKLK